MATVGVILDNADIIGRVRMFASFEGRTVDSSGKPLYDTVRITEQDELLVQQFIDEAKHNLLSSYAGMTKESASGIDFNIPSPYYLADLEDSIRKEVTSYIVNFCCGCWFDIRYPSRKKEYQDRGAMNIINLNNLVYSRKAPEKGTGTNTSGFITLS